MLVSHLQFYFQVIRESTVHEEIIEVKKVYKHPDYSYPALYNDIALVELGRRIHFDFDKVFIIRFFNNKS